MPEGVRSMSKTPGQETMSFKPEKDNEKELALILREVYSALQEKGYNPVNQLVGYMISGDPAYITSHKGARQLMDKHDRDEIMGLLLKRYLEDTVE